jgi:hypothetical protein
LHPKRTNVTGQCANFVEVPVDNFVAVDVNDPIDTVFLRQVERKVNHLGLSGHEICVFVGALGVCHNEVNVWLRSKVLYEFGGVLETNVKPRYTQVSVEF